MKSGRRLLQNGDRQALRLAQTLIVGVIADLAMSAPGGSGHALRLAMSRQPAKPSHKAKRRQRRQPGKPCRGIWLKWEQAMLGADHHVVPLGSILDEG